MTMNSKQGRIDASSWDGSLSRSEFYRAASAFAERWNKFNSAFPQCTWVPSPSLPWLSASTSLAEGYISVDDIILPCSTQQSNRCNDEEVEEELNCSDFTDDAMLVRRVLRPSTCVMFNSVDDGQPLALDDIEKNISANSGKVLMESKWTFITQEDHPYLNRPWCTLHPCGTREWMKMLFMNESLEAQDGVGIAKYLVSWFSVVGQIFDLKIPFEMLGNLG